jgi:protoporphyrinogen IX oxidase
VIAWVKLLHVTAIAFWAGGLICILFLHPRINRSPAEARIRDVMHFSLGTIIAPAAYIAIASGAWLIFLRSTFVPWFTFKLAFVGLLIIAHMLIARSIMNLFGDRTPNSLGFLIGLMTVIGVAVMGVLVLVLAKPEIDMREYAAIYEPGALRDFAMQYWPFRHLPL